MAPEISKHKLVKRSQDLGLSAVIGMGTAKTGCFVARNFINPYLREDRKGDRLVKRAPIKSLNLVAMALGWLMELPDCLDRVRLDGSL